MRKALFYLTYNGIYNFTNGIGTQTQLLLRGLERLLFLRCGRCASESIWSSGSMPGKPNSSETIFKLPATVWICWESPDVV